ncbi:aldose 1-epimerase [Pseudomonas sp. 15FMM2]|uniref:Aldose 1-epimerase n=1 Tax=Pseudomonas imrae TaxID=2992837 RepID=A0ACC7PB21_9PSED
MNTPILELTDDITCLTLAPALGGSIVNWSVCSSGQPLLRHSPQHAIDAGLPGKLGCFPLVPWSNRIAEGGFDTPGGWQPLTPNAASDALPIHGSAWQQAWQVLSQTPNEVVLQLESSTPFAYRAQQRFSLEGGELSIQLQVTHLAQNASWHGLGLHPYFPRRADTRLQAKAAQVWLCDETKLPTGLAPVASLWDFSRLRRLPEGLVDNGFCQWDGQCVIEQPELGYALQCLATGADYFLLYCPPGLDFFCIEPVSHPVNAHHLPGRPGLKLLEFGESVQLGVRFKYRALQERGRRLAL